MSPDRSRGCGLLTRAQRDLIVRMGFVPNVLRNDDELTPKWWLEGRAGAVKANVALSLIRRGLVRLTGRAGGWPGMDLFTVTPAGRRAALSASTGERRDG